MNTYTRSARRGSALLVCTLAAAVLSMAGLAILRSSRLRVAQVDALRAAQQAHCTSDGLRQRAWAILENDRNFEGTVTDPAAPVREAYADVRRLGGNQSQIQVFLYADAIIPAQDIIVDTKNMKAKKAKKPKKK